MTQLNRINQYRIQFAKCDYYSKYVTNGRFSLVTKGSYPYEESHANGVAFLTYPRVTRRYAEDTQRYTEKSGEKWSHLHFLINSQIILT
jgi:hypothetical protein